jgi:hypothetical protein
MARELFEEFQPICMGCYVKLQNNPYMDFRELEATHEQETHSHSGSSGAAAAAVV